MSYHVSACGAFGILLDERADVKELLDELTDYIGSVDIDDNHVDESEQIPEFTERFRTALAASGIKVPATAALHWTGNEDDRPGQTATAGNAWVLGFGLYTRPDLYPAMSESFIKESQWHTWVTGS